MVPQSQVVLRLPIDAVRSLPHGAEFRDKSGQASASVQFDQDTVYVFATCDSLQRMCSYYERTSVVQGGGISQSLAALTEEVEEEKEEKPPDTSNVFLAGVLVGILLVLTAIGLLRR